jgi:hypothetical protein
LLERHGSFSRIDPARIRITPKSNFAGRGITIRSFSRYLALNYEAVDVSWWRVEPPRWRAHDCMQYTLVLLPWPLRVPASAFRPVPGALDNMDPDAFGFFEFAPETALDLDLVERLVLEARRKLGRIHAVILPEDAIDAKEVAPLEERLLALDVIFLIAGVREPSDGEGMDLNIVHLSSRSYDVWYEFDYDFQIWFCV